MNTIEITSQPQVIAVSKLDKSPLNARRTKAKMGMDELKASILAHGLMQNLVVTDAADGTFRVIAGGRRLEAIRALQAESKLSDDFAVPCQVVNEEHALEMSLAENIMRLAMHPADQFEAFAALIDQGQTAAEVARRFGIEESLVLKRMKLARVAPSILKEYRNDGLTLEGLMAFTLTDDHRKQVKVFKSLQDWQKQDPSAIRDALTEQMVEAGSKVARFVGLDAYTAAGGTSRADLFGEEVYLEKPDLIHKLAEGKLSAIRKELESEGWGWIDIHPERDWTLVNRCSRIMPRLVNAPVDLIALKSQLDAEREEIQHAIDEAESDALIARYESIDARLEDVERQLTAFIGFDTEQKKLAGCFVSIGQDGSPHLDTGLVKPEHRWQLAKLQAAENGDAAPIAAKPKSPLSEALRRELAAHRLQAAQVEIARHPEIALDLLIFQAASRLLDDRPVRDGAAFEFGSCKGMLNVQGSSVSGPFTVIRKMLPAGWRKPKTEVARFQALRSLPQAGKLKLLAYCVAMTLQPKLAPASLDEATAYDAALDLTGGDMSGYWRPGKDGFLTRINRNQLLAIARDTLGDMWAQSRQKDKKAALVEQLDRAFADPGRHGKTPEQVGKLKNWLPAGMALSLHIFSTPSAKKKARKAA